MNPSLLESTKSRKSDGVAMIQVICDTLIKLLISIISSMPYTICYLYHQHTKAHSPCRYPCYLRPAVHPILPECVLTCATMPKNHVRIRSATAFVLDLVPYHVNKPERRGENHRDSRCRSVICLGENLFFFCASLWLFKKFTFE